MFASLLATSHFVCCWCRIYRSLRVQCMRVNVSSPLPRPAEANNPWPSLISHPSPVRWHPFPNELQGSHGADCMSIWRRFHLSAQERACYDHLVQNPPIPWSSACTPKVFHTIRMVSNWFRKVSTPFCVSFEKCPAPVSKSFRAFPHQFRKIFRTWV